MTLRDLIAKHEGLRLLPYQDSKGYWTVGVGHCIDPRAGCAPLDPDVVLSDGSISVETCGQFLSDDIAKATLILVTSCTPWFQALDPVRQAVLIDMAFNLGDKLLEFHDTLRNFAEGNWQGAADGMLESLWAQQVKARATEDAEMVLAGQWPDDITTNS